MLITLNGNIATEVKSNYMMKNGQYIPDQRTGRPLVVTEFSIAVPRQSKGNREKTTLDGKNYTSDLYRIKAIGQKAEFLSQYASKGRSVCIQGYLLQDEFLSTNQSVQLDKTNPLYGLLSGYVNVPNSPVQADNMGNLYIFGNTKSKSFTVEVVEVEFNGANPNGNNGHNFDPSAFTPNQNMAQGFPNANPMQQTGMPLTPQPGTPLNGGLAPNPQFNPGAQSFNPGSQPFNPGMPPFGTNANGMMPNPNMAPPQQMANMNMMSQQMTNMNGVAMQQQQQNPQQQGSYPGWGDASQVPESFTNIQQPMQQTPVANVAPTQATIQTQEQTQQPVTQTQQSVAQGQQEQNAQQGASETLTFAPSDKSNTTENVGF